MKINYEHNQNTHTLKGSRTALKKLLKTKPRSLLDVGCGEGQWMKAAKEIGIREVFGVDGIRSTGKKYYEKNEFKKIDFRKPWSLCKKFDLVISLEVAEHLDQRYARKFVQNLCKHGAQIIFSAACPGQPGQHHVNCQWPSYWQTIFNAFGYACYDNLRYKIWNNADIEPWYRQNIFSAKKSAVAGTEPRLRSILHPEMFSPLYFRSLDIQHEVIIKQVRAGSMPLSWYMTIPLLGPFGKLKRKIEKFGTQKPKKLSELKEANHC